MDLTNIRHLKNLTFMVKDTLNGALCYFIKNKGEFQWVKLRNIDVY